MLKFLAKVYFGIIHFIGDLFATLALLLEFFLFVRLLLKALSANAHTLVVSYLYQYTDIAVSPFNSIFPSFYWGLLFIDTPVLAAMVGYAIAAFIIYGILSLLGRG